MHRNEKYQNHTQFIALQGLHVAAQVVVERLKINMLIFFGLPQLNSTTLPAHNVVPSLDLLDELPLRLGVVYRW